MSLKNPNVLNPRKRKRIAIVISNSTISPSTGWPVGFWWSELTHPYYVFQERGYDIEIFSPRGGRCEPDNLSDPRDTSGYSAGDLISMGFISTPSLAYLVHKTIPISELNVDAFDAIMVTGGMGPMFTFDKAIELHQKFVEFYESGKVTCALCHGVAVLKYARLSNGNYLVKDKTLTGFANIEEDFLDYAAWDMKLLSREKHVVPWRIEDEMKSLGGNYIQAGLWRGFAVRDGNLITGQQAFSSTETAIKVVEALGQ